jgi:plastocyanin
MRLRALPLPLVLLLILAAPASAADADVTVTTLSPFFSPRNVSIDVGDAVSWTFADGGHTTVSRPGQAESWDSEPGRNQTNRQGVTFEHVFRNAGRFQYVCDPHTFMTGTITVGRDSTGNTLERVEHRRSGNRVTVSFTLNEPATVTYRLKGATKRTVRRGRLRKGRHDFSVSGLDTGSHTGTLIARDDFDKRDSVEKTFRIR